jgi:hypothetical protein
MNHYSVKPDIIVKNNTMNHSSIKQTL